MSLLEVKHVVRSYRQGGLLIGLGSRPGNAAVLGALGLALARPGDERDVPATR